MQTMGDCGQILAELQGSFSAALYLDQFHYAVDRLSCF